MTEIAPQAWSIQQTYRHFREGKLRVNRKYQRKLVWTIEEKQKLIETILSGYPLPAIIVAERDGDYEIIDGLQRLNAIMSFIEMDFSVDGKYFDVDQFSGAKSKANEGLFTQLTDVELLDDARVNQILYYQLSVSIMSDADETSIDDVFGRINTYGHRLSDQERRQAGCRNSFSALVRKVAEELRGDVSADMLDLSQMAKISIDVRRGMQGYGIKAESTFWVKHGILRATDLRDSMDEQVIADILASVVKGEPIDRNRTALDTIYSDAGQSVPSIDQQLSIYDADKLKEEFFQCISIIDEIVDKHPSKKLRTLIFSSNTTNAFPSVFSVICLAIHGIYFHDRKEFISIQSAMTSLENVSSYIDTSRGGQSAEARLREINSLKGRLSTILADKEESDDLYQQPNTAMINSLVNRSQTETSNSEFKQGILNLSDERNINDSVFEKVMKTIVAIANAGPSNRGAIIIGITDSESDAERIATLDSITPREVGGKQVVGVQREINLLNETAEDYLNRWRDALEHSTMTPELKASVLSNLDFHDYFGLGLLIINVNSVGTVCYFDDSVYIRKGPSTVKVTKPADIVDVSKRFI